MHLPLSGMAANSVCHNAQAAMSHLTPLLHTVRQTQSAPCKQFPLKSVIGKKRLAPLRPQYSLLPSFACLLCLYGPPPPPFPLPSPIHTCRQDGGEGEGRERGSKKVSGPNGGEGGHRSSRGNILVTYADRYCSELEVLNMCGEHFSDYAARTSLDCRLIWGGRLCVL